MHYIYIFSKRVQERQKNISFIFFFCCHNDNCNCCNDYSIGVELEGCDDEIYCDAQYITLAKITELVCQRWQKIKKDRIVGHSDIAPGRKTDPGLFFDMNYYLSLLTL